MGGATLYRTFMNLEHFGRTGLLRHRHLIAAAVVGVASLAGYGPIASASASASASPASASASASPAQLTASAVSPLFLPPAHHAVTLHGPGTNWGVGVAGAPPCDPLGGQSCMLPFPNDYYTVPDPSEPSGRRVDFPLATMPANTSGVHIDPATWNANDGFSPGSTIEVHVPGLDLARSDIVDQYHVAGSLSAGAPVVLLDATTGRRLAWWGEADARDPDPASQLLLIHPAADLPEGHRIVVALRNLRTATGAPIAPSGPFAEALAGQSPPGPGGPALAAHLRHLVSVLAADAGVSSNGLFLAWDFTVVSTANLTGPAVAMRDTAMADLHGGLPHYQVTAVTNLAPSADGGRTIARQVTGTLDVPNFLDGPSGDQTDVLHLGADGLPTPLPGNFEHAVFSCLVPRSVDGTGRGSLAVAPGGPSSTARVCSPWPLRWTPSGSATPPTATGWCCARPTGSASTATTRSPTPACWAISLRSPACRTT